MSSTNVGGSPRHEAGDEPFPKRISHSLSFPLTLYNKASPSISSKFTQLREKIKPLPTTGSSDSGSSSLIRAKSLRNTARRLSGSRSRPESLPPVPGRRKGVNYAEPSVEFGISEEARAVSPVGRISRSIEAMDLETVTIKPPIIPEALVNGLSLMRVTHKKKGQRIFRIDPQTLELSWDAKPSSRCSIDFIEDIREGEEATYYRESLKVSSSLSFRWATIVYRFRSDNRSKRRLLHVVAQSMADFRMFIGTLKRLAIYRQQIGASPGLPQHALLEDWTKFASSGSEMKKDFVTIEGVQKILRKFYIYCSQAYLKKKFAEVDAEGTGNLTFSKFEKLVQMLKVRPEIQEIFEKAVDMVFPNSQVSGISLKGVAKFCSNVQMMTLDSDAVGKLFGYFSLSEGNVSGITVEGFSELLMSENYMPLSTAVSEDLTHPLTDYFISSSHNTYLVGRQLAGHSSIEPYIEALKDGCRCIEIDCWDGDDGPIVNHGRTFTSSVSFLSVIDTINRYAFRDFPLPVILSLEVHCNIENQHKMVEIMEATFQEKLVKEPMPSSALCLPSPAELKNRVLIKVKAGSKHHDLKLTIGMSGSSSLAAALGGAFASSSDGGGGNEGNTSTFSSITTDSSVSELEEESRQALNHSITELNRRDAAKCNISERLGALGVYVQGIKFRNFSLPISKTINHCFSFSEEKMNALIRDEIAHAQLVKHNKKYFLRVYPSGYRVNSSNYDPIPYWKRGAQMVSLNWQTYGEFFQRKRRK